MHTGTAVTQVGRPVSWCWHQLLAGLNWLLQECQDDEQLPLVVGVSDDMVSVQRPVHGLAVPTWPLVLPCPLPVDELVARSDIKGDVHPGDHLRPGPDGYTPVPSIS